MESCCQCHNTGKCLSCECVRSDRECSQFCKNPNCSNKNKLDTSVQQSCCQCGNKGKCKSCECSRSNKGCESSCKNIRCCYKTDASGESIIQQIRKRPKLHPYANSSDRNRKIHVPSVHLDQSVTQTASPPPATNQTSDNTSVLASVTSSGTLLVSANDSMQSRVEAESKNVEVIRTSLMSSVQNMSEREKSALLESLIQRMPYDVFVHLSHLQTPITSLPWCVCGRCKEMEQPRMNLCCGQQTCITSTTTFYNVCQRSDVIEISNILNWSFQFNDDPSFGTHIFRNQAYRNFVLWQWGRLGPGNRRIVPSCVVVAIRARFPSPNGNYTGYHSSEEF